MLIAAWKEGVKIGVNSGNIMEGFQSSLVESLITPSGAVYVWLSPVSSTVCYKAETHKVGSSILAHPPGLLKLLAVVK